MSAATSNLVRRVFVDDDDRAITYRGPWTVDDETFEEYPQFGPVYRGSQHRLLGDEGSLTFSFRGTGWVAIVGTSNPRNTSGVYDPSHTCRLDGVKVPPEQPLGLPINVWPLCITNSTSPGDHVFTLSAVSTTRALYVDQISYAPDREEPPLSPTVAISRDDLAVEYLEGSWKSDKAAGMLTQEAGAKMSITFIGSRATFFGIVPNDYPGAKSTATYSLDGGSPVTFEVPSLLSGSLPMFGQPFFEVTDLGPGTHELLVTYNGPAAPLVFQQLLVEDGSIMQSALTRDVGGGNPSGGKKKAPLGAIIGGAVGGAVLLLALLALILLMRKRKKKQRAQAATAVFTPPYSPAQPTSPLSSTYEVKPLMMSGQAPPSTFQTVSNTATGESLPQGPMPAYYGHYPNPSASSYSGGPPFNPSAHASAPHNVIPIAPASMSVSYQRNGPAYSRAPEPMA